MDPLSVIFVPGAIASALALLSPLALLGHRFWRRRTPLLPRWHPYEPARLALRPLHHTLPFPDER